MPPTQIGTYDYTAKSVAVKLTSAVGTAQEVVAAVTEVAPSQREWDVDDDPRIGMINTDGRPKQKGAKTLELTLKGVSPAFRDVCKQSFDDPSKTVQIVVISDGRNWGNTTVVDKTVLTETYTGWVQAELVPSYSAGELAEWKTTFAIIGDVTVVETGGPA